MQYQRKVMLFALMVFYCALCSCNWVNMSYPTCPTVFEGESAAKKLDSVKQWLSVTDIAFFNNKLFLSTSSGILEYEGDHIQRVYKCRTENWDTFENLEFDRIKQHMWTASSREFVLLQFDGANWTEHKVPPLPDGQYYSRADASAGFVGVNHDGKYFLQNNERMWSYDGDDKWTPFAFPKGGCEFENPERSIKRACFSSMTATDRQLFIIFHGNYVAKSIASGLRGSDETPPETDIIAYKHGKEWKIVNPTAMDGLFTEKMTTAPNAVFISTNQGKIFRVDETGIEPVESLGLVDALAVTSAGNLLACFKDKGIYEFTNGWSKRSDLPFGSDSNLTVNKMAEDSGTIVVVAGYPWVYNVRTPADRAWILKDGNQMPIL